MNILILLIPLALALAVFFMAAFIWASRSGQWDDLDLPQRKMLFDFSKKEMTTKGRKDAP